MFELKITGIYEAEKFVNNRWATHCISLVDPEVNPLFLCKNHLILKLHDVETPVVPEWILPNKSHVDQILEFTKNLGDNDKLLIHCHQGVSRSTAVAIGVLLQHGFDPESAYRYVENIRDILLPNGLITRMLDERFALNGELTNIVISERKEKMKLRMDDKIDTNNENNLVAMKSILEKLKDLM
jgi:predicted protein tyrosine phosphatase